MLAAARNRAFTAYQATKNGEEGSLTDQNFDDWRISSFRRVNVDPFIAQWPGLNIEVYNFEYQFHSATPENVIAAGGAYVDEEGWFGGFYTPEGPYLVFHIRDGQRILLDCAIPGDTSANSPAFRKSIIEALERNNVPLSPALSLVIGHYTYTAGIVISSPEKTIYPEPDDMRELFIALEKCVVSAIPYPEHSQSQESDLMFTITVNYKSGQRDMIFSTETGKTYYRFLDTYGSQGDRGYVSAKSREVYDLIVRLLNGE